MPNLNLPPTPPVAVVDIGSNSVRLVVYDSNERAPFPVFNEKVLCGLGRELDVTGALPEDGVKSALDALDRFVGLARAMDAHRIDILATAAVREATNGPDFVAAAEKISGEKVFVLTGEEEARYSAWGLMSGTPDADGILGDLGGGSVELVDVSHGEIGPVVTLPLGPIRFDSKVLKSPSKAVNLVDDALASVDFLSGGKGRAFYAVGGAWRSIAKLHMVQTDYPLHIIHHYRIPYEKALDFTQFVAKLSQDTLGKTKGISKRRQETLPFAGMLMNRLLQRIKPTEVVMSAYGLREGSLYGGLSDEVRARDPLIESCRRFVSKRHRAGIDGDTLFDWISPAFADDTAEEKRLRHAACMLAEIARPEHPDYRAEHSLIRVLRLPFVGIDHHERAFVSFAVSSRHAHLDDSVPIAETVSALLSPQERARARSIGLAMRLAFTVSGGIGTILGQFTLRRVDDTLLLEYGGGDGGRFHGDAVERRLAVLAKSLGLNPAIQTV